jgi:phosphoribosyl 1,2-cyclic phosphodiesterase
MLRFISFGSGSSGNCYYLFNDCGGIIIDAGIGVRMLKKYFDQYGLKFSNVKAILLTHDHADHVKSVGSLSRDYNLPVYATKKVHEGIDNNYIVHYKVSMESRHYINAGESFNIDDFEIMPVIVPHDSSDNVGYRINYGGTIFVLITDAGHVTTEMAQLISEANYLVFESNHEVEKLIHGRYPDYLKKRILSDFGHLSNEDCGNALRDYATPNLKRVWLCHLSYDNNDPELARYTVEGILRDKGIILGKDFELDVLKRKTPSEIFNLE